MNISEAKKISIVEYLKQIGYSPVKIGAPDKPCGGLCRC